MGVWVGGWPMYGFVQEQKHGAMKQPLGGCEQQHKHRVKITGSEPVESTGVGDGWLTEAYCLIMDAVQTLITHPGTLP